MKKYINYTEFSHHDLGWHKADYEEEVKFAYQELNQVLDMMETNKNFAWTHESSHFLMRYLEAYPENLPRIRKFVKEGRLAFGANYSIPYTTYVGEEVLVRSLMLGKNWVEKVIPEADCQVYFNTDVPALNRQLPQILHKAEVEYLFLTRTWTLDDVDADEYMHVESPDGSIEKVHFNKHYGQNYSGLPTLLKGPGICRYLDRRTHDKNASMEEFIDQVDACVERSDMVEGNIPFIVASDCMMPADMDKEIDAWNNSDEGKEFPIKYATYPEAMKEAFGKNPRLKKGEIPNKWVLENTACDYRAFMNGKEAGRLAVQDESLMLINGLLNGTMEGYNEEALNEIWKGACFCDHTFSPEPVRENIRAVYKKAFDEAKAISEKILDNIANSIDTQNDGTPMVVFNPTCGQRTDILEVDVPADKQNCSVFSANGEKLAVQKNGKHFSILTKDLPSLGWTTLYLKEEEKQLESKQEFDGKSFENNYYKIEFANGGLKNITDKEFNRELFDNSKFLPLELIRFNYDNHGCGEQTYMPQPCPFGWERLTKDRGLIFEMAENGPIKTVFTARNESSCIAIYTLTLYNDIKRIDLDITLERILLQKFQQPRIMFPIKGKMGVNYRTPFGNIELGKDEMYPQEYTLFNYNFSNWNNTYSKHLSALRPREVQDSICAHDEDFEVRFGNSNVVWDWQDPSQNPVKTIVLQAIPFSNSRDIHWLQEGFLTTGTNRYHFSIFSGKKDSGIIPAREHNHPLQVAFPTKKGEGKESYSLVSCEDKHVVVTAVKKAEDNAVILRFYSDETAKREVKFLLGFDGKKAEEVTLLERPADKTDFQEPVNLEKNLLTCDIAPFQIKTIKITL